MRFPEFKGEWNSVIYKSLFTIGNGRDYRHLASGHIPVFGTGGLITTVNDYLYKGETVFIGRKGTINKPFYFNGEFWTVDTLFYTHSFTNIIIPKFVLYLFQNTNWLKLNEASGVPSLSKSTIEQISCNIPSVLEQNKIACLLSLLDERIETQSKIIEDLKKLKSSLLDLLFQNNSKWSTFGISEVLTIGNGRDYKHLKEGNIPVYGTGGYMLSVNDYLYEGESVCIGRKGTIDMPMFLTGKFWTVDTLFYTYNFRNILPRFCYYLFTTINWQRYNEASGVPSLSKATIEKIKVSVPSINEQEYICSILDSINNKIDVEKAILARLKKQKQYLLQHMII